MSPVLDATGDAREGAVDKTAAVLRRGELAVLPTDTVYGVAADAFPPTATRAVFAAKGRSRSSPLPVLVRNRDQVEALAAVVPVEADRLIEALWPGPVTIVLHVQPGLVWDIGDNEGTVALRMPDDAVTLDVIAEVGPLAVTSANRSGEPPATTVEAARAGLGEAVAVYLDGGPREDARPSTIVDFTRGEPVVLRDGDVEPDSLLAIARGEAQDD
jgi:L-threonylcarbamoyladenylate synthase